MNKIIDFLKSEYQMFFAFLYGMLTFGAIFLLAELQMEYFALALEVILFGMLVYLLFEWIHYKRKENLSEKVMQLEEEHQRLKNQIANDKKGLEEYFLLWVHQIKTPITAANLILKKSQRADDQELKQQIFYINEYTDMAINYIKLMDRHTDMDITQIKLDDVIRPLLKKYSILFIEKRLSLSYQEISNEVIADTKWLSILVEQLLSNALKYTQKGMISIHFDSADNTLEVKDTGVGIRSEDLKKIFERGYSGFNGRINDKSSGLGLYLVKNIAKLLNIEVTVKSCLNEGSTFFVHFPSNLTNL